MITTVVPIKNALLCIIIFHSSIIVDKKSCSIIFDNFFPAR